jgi:hypothetical protein
MIKLTYLALVFFVLLPGVFAAVACIQGTREAKQVQRDEQSRTTDAVYVMHKDTTVGFGRFGVSLYPHGWAAILVAVGFLLSVVGLVFLFFVRS